MTQLINLSSMKDMSISGICASCEHSCLRYKHTPALLLPSLYDSQSNKRFALIGCTHSETKSAPRVCHNQAEQNVTGLNSYIIVYGNKTRVCLYIQT